jgi:hypothetical protein
MRPTSAAMPASMSPQPSPSSDSTRSIAEFLADREGLVGAARDRFRRLLHEYGGFPEVERANRRRFPILVYLLLGLTGLLWENPTEWGDRLAWVEYGVLSVGLWWQLRREDRRFLAVDRETHWEAYCLFLRPVILSDHPGLLDRNALGCGPKDASVASEPISSFRRVLHEGGRDLWWSGLVGVWAGTELRMVIHQALASAGGFWSLLFPVGGLLLGLAVWLLWRRLALRLLKADSRLIDP